MVKHLRDMRIYLNQKVLDNKLKFYIQHNHKNVIDIDENTKLTKVHPEESLYDPDDEDRIDFDHHENNEASNSKLKKSSNVFEREF